MSSFSVMVILVMDVLSENVCGFFDYMIFRFFPDVLLLNQELQNSMLKRCFKIC